MRAIQRYLALTVSLFLLIIVYFLCQSEWRLYSNNSIKSERNWKPIRQFDDFLNIEDLQLNDIEASAKFRRESFVRQSNRFCTMENCFDFSKCRNDFKVFVYQNDQQQADHDSMVDEDDEQQQKSIYDAILNSIRQSHYYTSDPNQACLFILAIDTLDRDKLSNLYVRNVHSRIRALDLWNDGKNHLIFNLYSGTWPDYTEQLDFNYGHAMLAKASISESNFREGFDISFPLFHKEHTQKGGEAGKLKGNLLPTLNTHKLVFKGKRYLTGIGSETRNTLYHIHNGYDMILLTTCRHGKIPSKLMDERCEEDDREYDKWDYKTLLINSTFCLVPRGRRLGSYRFLEALQAGCIPVLLSDSWVLPFSDVIDWNKAVIWGDERLLLQVPDIIRSINVLKINEMRQQTQFLWDIYFSSIEKIVMTTLEIIKERIDTQAGTRSKWVWNVEPGALATMPAFSESLKDYPFFRRRLRIEIDNKFTAVIYMTSSNITKLNTLLRELFKSKMISKIIVLCKKEYELKKPYRLFTINNKIALVVKIIEQANQRFYPYDEIETDAVLSLDDDALLITDEIDFAFSVWREFPERIVGYPSRRHFWHELRDQWIYSSAQTNSYSMVLTCAAFYHKYYNYFYTYSLQQSLHDIVSTTPFCSHILINFLVSHVTKRPPIKVLQRKITRDSEYLKQNDNYEKTSNFIENQNCMVNISKVFGYMPLLKSELRFDPLLYKDHVAKIRKRYKNIENISWRYDL